MPLPVKIDWRICAPLFVICAGVCWGIIGLFSQALAARGLDSVQITTIRCVLAAATIGLFLLFADRNAFRIRLRDIWMFLGTGILSIAFFNVCYFACIQESGLSIAAILLYTAPCFVVVMSAMFFKERFTRQKLIALVVAFCGCLLVVGLGSSTGGVSGLGIALGLGSGIGYALYTIFARVALKRYAPHTVMFYTFLCASIAMVPFSRGGDIFSLAVSVTEAGAVMLALALVSTVAPFAFYTLGLEHMEAGKASIMAFVEPMVALIVGVTVFGDVLTPLNVIGIVCIVCAVALLNIRIPDRARNGLS